MPTTFSIRTNDTKALTAQFLDSAGAAVDITAGTVKFTMVGPGTSTSLKVNRGTVTITTAASGKVSYPWQAGETDTAGTYRGEFEVTYSGGLKETFPADKDLTCGGVGVEPNRVEYHIVE